MTKLRAVRPITHILSPKPLLHNSNSNFSPKHLCLSLFTSISSMRQLLQIHSYLLTSGLFFIDKFLVSETLRFCSLHPSGDISHARALLLHCPSSMSSSWNHVIRGLCLNSSSADAVSVFLEMRRREAKPNELTYPFVIKSCAKLLDLCVGRQAHADSIKNAVESVVYVGNTLMHLYGLCGEVHDARRMFDGMSHKTIVSWNTILNIYVDSLMMKEAMKLFGNIMYSGIGLDQTTYIIMLSASSLMGCLGLGRWVHSQIICREIEFSLKLGTSLVHMYAKCGALDFAAMEFKRMPVKNVWTWSAMILGFSQHGRAQEALDLFKQMNNFLIEPNYVTFLGVLCACSHAGLVDDGYRFFQEMVNVHNIKPEISHYSTMVDVLGRKGLLLEAYNFIKKMPIDPDAVVWRTLLNACQLHITRDDHGIGEVAKNILLALEPNRCGNYVIVANMYSELGSWDEAAKVRKIMREEGLKKMAGESCIEISGLIYRFMSGYDSSIERADEGLYAWIAANYALGTLGKAAQETTGIVELGGASAQITFVPSEPMPPEFSLVVKFGQVTYNLYSHSFLHLGQNMAYEYLHQLLSSRDFKTSAEALFEGVYIDPCTPKGYLYGAEKLKVSADALNANIDYNREPHAFGNFSECRSAALTLLLRREKDGCSYKNCHIGSSFVPKLQGKLIATENFFHTSKFFGLGPSSFLSDLMLAGEQFCEEDWSKLKRKYHSVEEEDLLRYCFSSAYIVALLHDSLGIAMNDSRVVFANQVGQVLLDWALGAFIMHKTTENSSYSDWTSVLILFLLVAFIVLSILKCWKPMLKLKTKIDMEKARYFDSSFNR